MSRPLHAPFFKLWPTWRVSVIEPLVARNLRNPNVRDDGVDEKVLHSFILDHGKEHYDYFKAALGAATSSKCLPPTINEGLKVLWSCARTRRSS